MLNVLAQVALGVVGEVMSNDEKRKNSEDKKQIAIQESNNRRNVDIIEKLVDGAVSAYGIYGNIQQAKVKGQKLNNEMVHKELEVNIRTKDNLLIGEQVLFKVDYSSIWVDKIKGEFGADVIDIASGAKAKISYRIQPISNNKYKIYESVNGGKYLESGIIDWSVMTLDNVSQEDIGPIFADLARAVAYKLEG